jgi:hypothetical protein
MAAQADPPGGGRLSMIKDLNKFIFRKYWASGSVPPAPSFWGASPA